MNVDVIKTRIIRELSNASVDGLSVRTLKKTIGANIDADVFESTLTTLQDEGSIEWYNSGSEFYVTLSK